MRTLVKTLFAVLWVNGALAADRPWLQITVPSAAEAAASFPSPPPENGMTLWWGWDGPVSEPHESKFIVVGPPPSRTAPGR